jgi:hypothetical protein
MPELDMERRSGFAIQILERVGAWSVVQRPAGENLQKTFQNGSLSGWQTDLEADPSASEEKVK